MNFRKLSAAMIAAVAMISCQKNAEVSGVNAEEKINLTVKLPSHQTKLDGMATENAVTNLQVFVFDFNGFLEAYASGDAQSLTLSCSTGSKDVIAIVNASPIQDVKTLTDLESRKSDLADNSIGSFVMEGQASDSFTASSTVEIPVYRLASRVTLSQVSVEFEFPQHNSHTFELVGAYLVNVAGEKTYFNSVRPEKWYNKMMKEEGSPSVTSVSLNNVEVSESVPYTEAQHMYCYPNPVTSDANGGTWSARKTRLVVETKLGGKTYYYPVTFKDGMEANTVYDIKLKITRPGSSSPDQPIEGAAGMFTVFVQPWEGGESVEEII